MHRNYSKHVNIGCSHAETNPTVTQGRTQPSATASNAPTVQYVRAIQNISPFILRPLPSD